MLTNRQLTELSNALSQAIGIVLYAHDKQIAVSPEVVAQLRRINDGAKDLLSE